MLLKAKAAADKAAAQGDRSAQPSPGSRDVDMSAANPVQPPSQQVVGPNGQMIVITARHPLEHVDEITSILKTAFPLLALTMEHISDQLQQRFKTIPDEDVSRIIIALTNDAIQASLSPLVSSRR